MIKIDIPGRETLVITHLVLDYNGTIAVDGLLGADIRKRLLQLKEQVQIHILTADTYGTVRAQCASLGVEVESFPDRVAGVEKARIVRQLQDGVACMGNGFNDQEMFKFATLSIAVLEQEGLCTALLAQADILVSSARDGLDLLLYPDRLRATLRS